MRVVEVSGRTVDEAVERALDQLGLGRDQVDVDVIRESRKGLLGFGAEDAIVRVTAKEGVNTLPGAQRPGRGGRGRRGGRGGAGRPGDQSDRSASVAEREHHRAALQEEAAEDDKLTGSAIADADSADGADDTDGAAGDGQRKRRRRRGGRGRGRRGGGQSTNGARDDADSDEDGRGRNREESRERTRSDDAPRSERPSRHRTGDTGPGTPIPGAPEDPPLAPPDDAEDPIEFTGRTLRDILLLLGLEDTEIIAREPDHVDEDDDVVIEQVFNIEGMHDDASDELGVLIGRRGETMGSLQYLLNVIVSSRFDDDHMFSVDIEGYRRRREDSLVEMAQRVAAEVHATGDVITLEPMSASDRRIVHLTLRDDEHVVTESVGSGPQRQVEVLPASLAEDDD